jgi:putative ABC transport system ATP-binding protein
MSTALATVDETVDTSPVLQLVDVVKEYPGHPPVRAMDGVSLDIHDGELVAVVGASGSGKSTLMNIIGTLDRPTTGQVLLGGRAAGELSDARLAGLRSARIGFVFQQFHLIESISVTDNVATGLLYRGIRRAERRRLAEIALTRVGLGHRVRHRPPQLSGGERQRVAIARAIVGDPSIVLADEPTGNLDSRNSQETIELLRRLNAEGATIVVITHDRAIADSFPRRIVVSDGRIIEDSRS